MKVKRILQRTGFDIVRYRPVYETTIKPLDIRTVIDIGANVGKYSEESRHRFPDAKIYAFEPLRDCYEAIVSRMQEDSKFKAWNLALGNTSGKAVIERSSFHPSSSILHMSALHKKLYPKSKDSNTETISIEKLDEALSNESLEKNILVKIDVQGFENNVIKGGTSVISKSAVIIVENSFVQLYEDQPLFADIHNLLSDLGFMYYGSTERHYSQNTGRLIYEDSLFIKREFINP